MTLTERVLRELEARGRVHGYDLSTTTGIAPSSLYTMLHKLERQGYVVSQWEDESGRPRRYYTLTGSGSVLVDSLVNPRRLAMRLGDQPTLRPT